MGKSCAQFLQVPRAEFGESLVRCSSLLLYVRAPATLVVMGEDHDATPKDRSENSLKSVKPGCGRSDVSPIYLLQSPNSAMGAWRNRALKRTAFYPIHFH